MESEIYAFYLLCRLKVVCIASALRYYAIFLFRFQQPIIERRLILRFFPLINWCITSTYAARVLMSSSVTISELKTKQA